ncbi:hypothetical protein K0M31_001051 [Melipona bicolor]|uniref:Uncharacterized protein n=1 Tax=Melipona bicolor TaxID=60889 RepID=A0AA40GER6_9HYME|nr:hypothetical protein K0M31_001051 [Melipona bicolor]
MPAPEDRAERSNGENNGFSAVKIAWPDQAIHPWPSYPPDFTLSTSDERRRGKYREVLVIVIIKKFSQLFKLKQMC